MKNHTELAHYFTGATATAADYPEKTRLIYHYGYKPYDSLLTMRQQNERGLLDPVNQKRMEDLDASSQHRAVRNYSEHVSFFFDRPPFQLMLRNFAPNHIFWRDGGTVYEHVVDVAQIPQPMEWLVHSTPLDLFFYDWFWYKRPNTHPGHAAIIFKLRNMIKTLQGNTGSGIDSLAAAVAKYKNAQVTRADFIAGFKHPNYLENPKHKRTWYAPRVRHLNIYVDEPIPVLSVRPIKLQRNFQPNRPGLRTPVRA